MSACQNLPPPYAPPPQRTSFGSFRPYRISRIVDMHADNAMQQVVSDILAPSGGWSWTGKRPAVKIVPRGNHNVTFVADFTVPEATFKTTGPVTITFHVNGHTIETVPIPAPGAHKVSKDVPPDWVLPGKENIVGAEIDKLWVSPQDGAKLGFILSQIGLTEE